MALRRLTPRWSTLADRMRERFTVTRPRDAAGEDQPRTGLVVLVAVLLASLLWFVNSMREEYTTVVEMPTRVFNLQQGRALAQMPPQRVRVQVRGVGWQLMQLHYRPSTVAIDASRAEVNLDEAIRMLSNVPGGVNVLNVNPPNIQIETEPEIRRVLPVQLRADVQAASEYDLVGPLRLEPDSVVVSGARSVVSELRYWPTVLLRRTDVRTSFQESVPLADTLAGLVRRNAAEIRVHGNVERFTEGMREIPVRVEGTPPGGSQIRLIPEYLRVVYRVPLSLYEEARETNDFYATVSYGQILADTSGTVQPVLHFPPSIPIHDVRMEPRRLEYLTQYR